MLLTNGFGMLWQPNSRLKLATISLSTYCPGRNLIYGALVDVVERTSANEDVLLAIRKRNTLFKDVPILRRSFSFRKTADLEKEKATHGLVSLKTQKLSVRNLLVPLHSTK